MQEFLEKIKEKKRALFKSDYHEMLAAFNRENETVAGYNGRQLLELIQNCDDEGSNIVLLKLDKDNKTISISNGGSPFSKQGYRSLSISNLSSKTSKRKFIGNKGLGFRSIINWSNQIKIISNQIAITYSQDNIVNEYNSLFSKSTQIEIAKEYNYAKDVVPVPFLSLPKIESYNTPTQFSTTIEIHYKDPYYKDIIKQVKNIKPQTLLFLKNINEINFIGFDDIPDLKRVKTKLQKTDDNKFYPSEKISINNETWLIFEDENSIENTISIRDENEFYQLKLALKDDLNDNNNFLYSYFKTDIYIDFPYIIHGTFDLDQTRNRLNDTAKNKYVLDRLVNLIIDTAKYLSKENVSWKPLKLLSYSQKNTNLDKLGFYDKLDRAVLNEEIFPCIDNKYRLKRNTIYKTNRFSQIIKDVNGEAYFGNMLIPSTDINLIKYDIPSNIPNIIYKVDSLSKTVDSIPQRAELIYVVNDSYPNRNFNIIIDSNNELINKEVDIFTPTRKDISIPEYCDIKVINTRLFNILVNKFSLNSSKEKARDLQRKLKNNTKIHSFEPVPLALKIISNTNSIIKTNTDNPGYYIKQMVQSLYSNYKLSKENSSLPPKSNIPLLSKTGDVVSSKELFLSEYYPTGKITVDLFGDIYGQNDFLANYIDFGFVSEEKDIVLIEEFFLWLNVNKFAKYYTQTDSNYGTSHYLNYVQKVQGHINRTSINLIQYKSISHFKSLLTKLSFEKVIFWLFVDDILKQQLDNKNNDDIIKYYYYSLRSVYSKPSYIKYVLFSSGYDLNNHLLDENFDWLNNIKINYLDKLFFKYNITKRDIDNVLILLGAKDTFNELSIERVTKILEELPVKSSKGRNSQKIYRKAVQHYKVNSEELTKDVLLYAQDGNGLNLFPQSEIYFSDRIKIPKKLKNNYPILNFPPRSGGKDAIDFFKINNLKNLKIDISNFEINDSLTEDFRVFFETIKPFLLVYRINKIDKYVQKQKEASLIKNLQIKLCNKIEYSVDNIEDVIDENEFILQSNNVFLIKVNPLNSLKSLRKNSTFSDSFASIISQTFDVFSDANEFRYILRDDINDTEHSTIRNFGEELLIESKELLGLSDSKITFWKAIYTTLGKSFDYDINKDEWLESIIIDLDLDKSILEIDYDNISSKDNIVILNNLFNKVNIAVKDFNINTLYEVNLEKYHFSTLQDYFYQKAEIFKSTLWSSLNLKSIEVQTTFLDLIYKYENNNDYILFKSSELKLAFHINKELILSTFLKENFGSDFVLNQDISNDLIAILLKNEKAFTQEELDFLKYSKVYRSLMYFEDNISFLKQKYTESIKENEPLIEDVKDDSFVGYEIININDSFTLEQNQNNNHTYNSPFVPGVSKDVLKKRKGDKSEDIVYKKLVSKYGSNKVSWKSKEDEGMHYDIRYLSEDGYWKYVEVKSFSNNTFILTKSEKEFGEKYDDVYEIWLVNNNSKIYTLTNFFSRDDILLIPKDYLVSIQISIES